MHALDAFAALAALACTSPRRAAAVARAARRPTAAGRAIGRGEAVGRLRAYARVARLRPDILHFEWTTAAVHHFPLVDALDCPMVVSCRGADTNIYPHVPSTKKVAAAFPAVFARAAAVHCVANVIAETAVALGADPAATHVIRTAVDEDRFRPCSVRPARGDVFRLVGIGWLHWRKAYEDALTGFPSSSTSSGANRPPRWSRPATGGAWSMRFATSASKTG